MEEEVERVVDDDEEMEWTLIEALGKEEEERKLREGLDACCYRNIGE